MEKNRDIDIHINFTYTSVIDRKFSLDDRIVDGEQIEYKYNIEDHYMVWSLVIDHIDRKSDTKRFFAELKKIKEFRWWR